MGRRIVGFLVGLVISGVIFSVVAILSDDARAPRDGNEVAEQALVEPEISEPLPVREPKPVETVEEPAAEPLRPEPVEPEVEEKPAVVAEPAMQELPEEEAPMVVVEPAPQPAPAPNDTPQPKLAEPAVPAPLKKPGALTEVAPAPQPVAPVPNPPVEIARAEPEPEPEPVSAPEPEPAPEPQVESQPVPDAPAVVEVEPEVRQAPTEPPAEPVVRQSRLPVVSDDTSQSAGIQFGRPRTSTLPTVTSPDVADDPAVPSVTPFREAPPLVSAKRLVAPKSAEPESDTVTILTVEPEEPEAAPQKRRAIDVYGVLFDQGEKPTMSIILVDVGNAGVPLNEAATPDLPITFAVAVDRSDATLAESEEQVADLLTEFFAIVPQSVGLLDVPEATLQNDRVLSNHVLAALHETGHGVVTYEQGLNVVLREADKAGVPAGLIYRALDQKGESVDAIKRHLDRAATEASRSGHVLVIGSTRADTIEAIQSWTQSRAAQNVALAPVSASIKGNY
jgi:polysaccharide deacetylase 2 family uncharacterized protein YibQ